MQIPHCLLYRSFLVGFILLGCLMSDMLLYGQDSSAGTAAIQLADSVQKNNGVSQTYSIDFANYQKNLLDLPIGVFDSGVGGLTVLETLLTYDQHNNSNGRKRPRQPVGILSQIG